jgi:hypothetical protein
VGKEFIEAYLAGRSEVVVVDWWGSYYLLEVIYENYSRQKESDGCRHQGREHL